MYSLSTSCAVSILNYTTIRELHDLFTILTNLVRFTKRRLRFYTELVEAFFRAYAIGISLFNLGLTVLVGGKYYNQFNVL